MAMTKCGECGADISKSATACPKCGATRRVTRTRTWVIGGLAAAFVGSCIAMQNSAESDRAQRDAAKAQAEATRVAAMTPEQKANEARMAQIAKERAAAKEAAFQRAQFAAAAIRKVANDPGSISFHDAGYTAAGAVFLEYRGKNAFNATIKNIAIVSPEGKITNGAESQAPVIQAFNRYIANQTLFALPSP